MTTEHQLSFLVPASARSAHAELLSALGTENNPAQWMTFMDAVTKLLPDVLSSGRPSKETIQRCAIGQLGFSSWQAMIEGPTDAGGLGWNLSAWKAWRRAWTVVQANPWLRDESMTSSEINSLALDLSRDGIKFPGEAGELESIRKARKEAQEQHRTNSVTALTESLRAAETAAGEARAQIVVLNEMSKLAADREHQFAEMISSKTELIGTLKAEKAELSDQLKDLKNQLHVLKNKAPTRAPELSKWEHFCAIFGY